MNLKTCAKLNRVEALKSTGWIQIRSIPRAIPPYHRAIEVVSGTLRDCESGEADVRMNLKTQSWRRFLDIPHYFKTNFVARGNSSPLEGIARTAECGLGEGLSIVDVVAFSLLLMTSSMSQKCAASNQLSLLSSASVDRNGMRRCRNASRERAVL